jgi:hypothetical protein
VVGDVRRTDGAEQDGVELTELVAPSAGIMTPFSR